MKKLIVYGRIEFIEEQGEPVSATVHRVNNAVIIEEEYLKDAEVRMGKEDGDWLIPHKYKGKIIWK